MKVGDLVKISAGARHARKLSCPIVTLVEKRPRSDYLEYDWLVFAEGRFFKMGRQMEDSGVVISESR